MNANYYAGAPPQGYTPGQPPPGMNYPMGQFSRGQFQQGQYPMGQYPAGTGEKGFNQAPPEYYTGAAASHEFPAPAGPPPGVSSPPDAAHL
ncbi:hypothetical protein CANTEDRAFT_115308, partial [Yamadazyma tenuis ATCC 10573]